MSKENQPEIPTESGAHILKLNQPEHEVAAELETPTKPRFDEDLIRKYPRANKRVTLQVETFGLRSSEGEQGEDNDASHTLHISPHGFEFKTSEDFEEGSLIKIQVQLPDYWSRKQKRVSYSRVDQPKEFRVLAKVLRTEDAGKRGKKKLVVAQTLVIDSVDEEVLKDYLSEG